MKYYGFRTLQQELGRKGLPNSRPSITNWENAGKILKPDNSLRFHEKNAGEKLSTKDIRIYTKEEIQTICQQVQLRYEKNKKS